MSTAATVPVDWVRHLAEAILEAVGTPAPDAQMVVDSLIEADRRGVGTHGVLRLSFYVDRVRHGGIDPVSPVTTVQDRPGTALLDGGNGFGAVVTTRAMKLAIDKARRTGLGAVAARRMNHFGAAAYYAQMASEQNMVGIVMTNVTASMAATNGVTPVVGNNPIAFAVPAGADTPVIFDAATSRSSWGALLRAQQRGEPLDPGAFLGSDGAPSTDPAAVLAGGSLLPIEGYKGYGLALIIALLTGVLADGAFDTEIAHPYRSLGSEGDNSALVIALDVSSFVEPSAFAARTRTLGDEIRAGTRAANGEPIMLPGEREEQMARAQVSFIALEETTIDELRALACEFGVDVGGVR